MIYSLEVHTQQSLAWRIVALSGTGTSTTIRMLGAELGLPTTLERRVCRQMHVECSLVLEIFVKCTICLQSPDITNHGGSHIRNTDLRKQGVDSWSVWIFNIALLPPLSHKLVVLATRGHFHETQKEVLSG